MPLLLQMQQIASCHLLFDFLCHFCLKQKLVSTAMTSSYWGCPSLPYNLPLSWNHFSVCICGELCSSDKSWGHNTWPHTAFVFKSVHSYQTLTLPLTHAALVSTCTRLVMNFPRNSDLSPKVRICVFIQDVIKINTCPRSVETVYFWGHCNLIRFLKRCWNESWMECLTLFIDIFSSASS